MLADFEKGEALSIGQLAPESDLALAADRPPENPVLEELKSANVEKLSPLAAFDLLLRLKRRLDALSDRDRRGQPKSD